MKNEEIKEEKEQITIKIENLNNIGDENSIVPYWNGVRYKNYRAEPLLWQFIKTIYLLFPGIFMTRTNLPDLQVLSIDKPPLPQETQIAGPTFSWLGHSTMYFYNMNGLNILIDPTSGDVRPSPHSNIVLYKRHTAAPFSFADLPVDIILLSHNHEDHARTEDLQALAKKDPQPIIIAGEHSHGWLQSLEFKPENIKTLSWWDKRRIINRTQGKFIDLLGVPACHASQPKRWVGQDGIVVNSSLNGMLWLGFVLQALLQENNPATIYFSGDTGLGERMEDKDGNPHSLFTQINQKVPNIDIACIEISPEVEPEVHLGNENVLRVLYMMKPKVFIPVHHSCFRSDKRPVEAPIQDFLKKMSEKSQEEKLETTIFPLRIGSQISVTEAIQDPSNPEISRQFMPSF